MLSPQIILPLHLEENTPWMAQSSADSRGYRWEVLLQTNQIPILTILVILKAKLGFASAMQDP
jgi:hypothetical protein